MAHTANRVRKIALISVGSNYWIGGIYYIMNILNALNKTNEALEIHLFSNKDQNFMHLDQFKNISIIEHDYLELFTPNSLYNKVISRFKSSILGYISPRVEGYLLRNNFDFVFPAQLSEYRGKLNVGSWIADFQHINFPDGSSSHNIKHAERVISDIANNSSKIVLSSKSCETECHEYFPKSIGKTHVMPFAVYINPSFITNNLLEIREKYQLPQHYIVVSNLFAPTKDHKTLFEALSILKSKGIKIPLFCTGNFVDSRNIGFPNEILGMLTHFNIRELVNILGLIPRADQIAIYRMATFLVQPSLHEGWNTTVEEAKALGKEIIVSDIDVHKEQITDSYYHFKKGNALDLANKISEVWSVSSNNTFPNPEIERLAMDNYEKEVTKFGTKFLEIANI